MEALLHVNRTYLWIAVSIEADSAAEELSVQLGLTDVTHRFSRRHSTIESASAVPDLKWNNIIQYYNM